VRLKCTSRLDLGDSLLGDGTEDRDGASAAGREGEEEGVLCLAPGGAARPCSSGRTRAHRREPRVGESLGRSRRRVRQLRGPSCKKETAAVGGLGCSRLLSATLGYSRLCGCSAGEARASSTPSRSCCATQSKLRSRLCSCGRAASCGVSAYEPTAMRSKSWMREEPSKGTRLGEPSTRTRQGSA